ncbi:OmpA family protein [Undibacterium sp. RuRC25W]|uniref:OmpA family protein n=1 Tax=Undibacterium sp. RuRC25W TaxID=3413047 RepID=UPI003BF04348
MKKITMTPAALLMIAILTACSTAPKTTSLLEVTRQQYLNVQNNPRIAQLAPSEMRQASDAMSLANQAAQNNESADEINKFALLAKTKIDTAEEAAKQKNAENNIANAGKQRDQMRLEQRTTEVDQQKNRADYAERSAQIAQSDTQRAQGDMQRAQGDTQKAQQKVVALSAELADLKAKNTDRGVVITLGDLLFGFNDARLKPEGIHELQKLADVLQTNQQQKILVEGYTDSTGGAAYNLQLSERRANAVSSALQLMGVQRSRIAIHGYGEEFPVAENTNSENRQLNRRVEIILSDANGNIINR